MVWAADRRELVGGGSIARLRVVVETGRPAVAPSVARCGLPPCGRYLPMIGSVLFVDEVRMALVLATTRRGLPVAGRDGEPVSRGLAAMASAC